ncbi:MAG: site-2 protease family protein [Brevinematales bacterium]|nr:site-2 protease family protein [Brevinematales bacterium]
MQGFSLWTVVWGGVFALGVFFSIVLHEIGHGLVALWWGDDTAKQQGRLSFSPLAHVDPVGTILVPVLMYLTTQSVFGWAKPVPINPMKFRHWRWGNFTVSLAGVTMNVLLAILLVGISFFVPHEILFRLIVANLFLAFFNLLPLPPLDGFRVVMSMLPASWQKKMEPYLFPLGIILIMVFVNSPFFSFLVEYVLGGVLRAVDLLYRLKA